MTKPKIIIPSEEFIAEGYVWSYTISDNKVKFSVLRKHDGKMKKEIEAAMQGHIIAKTELIGIYKRQ